MKTKTGIDLINQERTEQVIKHLRTPQYDAEYNSGYQLKDAARALLIDNLPQRLAAMPKTWEFETWQRICEKKYADRVITSAAFLAAELDRLEAASINKIIENQLKDIDEVYESLKDMFNSKYGADPGADKVLNGLKQFRHTALKLITK